MTSAASSIPPSFRTKLWHWYSFTLDAWALVVAVLFLIVGFVGGYEVSQPSRYSGSAQDIRARLDSIEKILDTVQSLGLPDIRADQRKLDDAVAHARKTSTALPAASAARLKPDLDEIEKQGEAIDHILTGETAKLDTALSAHLKAVRAERRIIEDQFDAARGTAPLVYDQSKRFLKWIGAISFLTIVAILFFVLVILNNPRARRAMSRSTGSISAFGVSITLRDIQSERDSIEARQRAVSADLTRTYTGALRVSKIEPHFRKVMEKIVAAFAQQNIDLSALHYRATLYVPDFVGEVLVQATRYVGNWRVGDEKVVGRRFSVRYGIIGKAWRLLGPQYNSHVVNTDKNLIRNWGFSAEEAAPFVPGTAAGSLMAFVVKDSGSLPPLAVIYLEAEGANKLHNIITLPNARAEKQDPDPNGFTEADRYAAAQLWAKVENDAVVQDLKTRLHRLQSALRWNDKVDGGVGR